jgi:hypothetical protein
MTLRYDPDRDMIFVSAGAEADDVLGELLICVREAVKAEREACAKLADDVSNAMKMAMELQNHAEHVPAVGSMADELALRIRARSER